MALQNILIGALAGGITNVIVEMKANNGLVFPTKLKTKLQLGFLQDFVIGALAGALFVTLLRPEEIQSVILTGAMGGFGGIGTIERIARLNGSFKDEQQIEIIKAKIEELDKKS